MLTYWGKFLGAAAVLVLAAGATHAQQACDTDFNGDGVIDDADVEIFQAYLGSDEGDEGFDPAFDLDGDGAVTIADFNIVLSCK